MLVEIAAALVIWGLIATASRRVRLGQVSTWSGRLTRHPLRTVVAIGILSGLLSVGLTNYRGVPVPMTHDEFSYLLAGETYAQGRLTNPPHPFWQHFEAMHIIQQPTRMSKYPAGQGVVLAIGKLLAGHPIVGVWLSLVLASIAIGWMLLAWLPIRWALLGTFCAALRTVGSEWGNGYWGGAVAAAGGALLLGAVRRLADRPDWRGGTLFGTGLVILANSRPFEGLVVASASGLVLAVAWWRLRPFHGVMHVLHVTVPAFLVVLAGAAAMGISNAAVTGNAWQMPYQAHDSQYAGCPTFLFQTPGPLPEYRHADMEGYFSGWERNRFVRKHVGWGFNPSYFTKLRVFLEFFIGPALLVPYLMMVPFPAAFWPRSAWLIIAAALLGATQTLYLFPHYLAPVTGLVWFVVVLGTRRLAACRMRGFRQPALVVLLLVAAGAGPLIAAMDDSRSRSIRGNLAERLLTEPGRDLVLLDFGPDYDFHESWVYNAADLDESPIVWARSLGDEADAGLRGYYADRRAWRVSVGYRTAILMPDERTASPPAP